eukprot:CAMPEP_0178460742 /NCGR_PEP_ID=MMETSP0689_2-20121128/48894_1 /TAXON_ID=160604 /ORGANISM="Amphidinium massartii, Strain CS-259" /LENGTH=240 /DNA_ID=CAMNT_0020087443 /DNA_START=71 /DNA_END=793 /DNA_ORIENTATION=-
MGPCDATGGGHSSTSGLCKVRLAFRFDRRELVDFIQARKEESPSYKVIDLGGAMIAGTPLGEAMLVDAFMDILEPPPGSSSGDANEPEGWESVLTYVQSHGKFDLAICSHTLEDLRNPVLVSRRMQMIAKAGFVAVPSKHEELNRWIQSEGRWRGYLHHRWIYDFNASGGHVLAFPKLTWTEWVGDFDLLVDPARERQELQFWWQTELPLRVFNEDFMGPNGSVLIYDYTVALLQNMSQL